MNTLKTYWVWIVIILILVIGGYMVFIRHGEPAGAAQTGMLAENYLPYVMNNGGYNSQKNFKIGANGSDNNEIIATTCNALGMDVSQTSTTTASYDCAVTGANSADIIVASFSTTSTQTLLGGWAIVGAKASSTSGFVTLRVMNLTGSAAAPSITAVGSSTNIIIFDTD